MDIDTIAILSINESPPLQWHDLCLSPLQSWKRSFINNINKLSCPQISYTLPPSSLSFISSASFLYLAFSVFAHTIYIEYKEVGTELLLWLPQKLVKSTFWSLKTASRKELLQEFILQTLRSDSVTE